MNLDPGELERLNALAQDLLREDDLGKVIRAHIRLEELLNRFLHVSVFHPARLRGMEMDFNQKVHLAEALGLGESLAKPLRSLGKLRNDFAHKSNAGLTSDRLKSLYECLDPANKEQLHLRFLELKSENTNIKHFAKFQQLSTHDQFVMIIILLWAGLETSINQVLVDTGRA